MPDKSNNPFQFWEELKRRKVVRVITMYAGAAFIIMEAADIMLPRLGLPDWIVTLIIILLIIGFPVAVILSWIYDFTPEGWEKTKPAEAKEEAIIEPLRRKFRVSDGVIILLVVIVCIFLYPKIFKKDKFEDLRNEDGRITLAVMSFENLTGDSTLNFWQRGISEILINDLGASKELLVASSLTLSEVHKSMRVKYSSSLLPAVANETAEKLKSRIYITGKYQQTKDKLRLMVNVVDTEERSILWTHRIDGNLLTDYLQLADSMSVMLKNYLEIEAIKADVDYDFREAFVESSEAYRFYIEGIDLLLNEEYELATIQFQNALEIDSTFVMASFYMAWAILYSSYQIEDVTKWISKAYQNIEEIPGLYQNWLGIWHSFFISKDIEEILRYCNLLSNSDTKSRLILLDAAFTYQNFGLNEEAINLYERIMEISEEWGKNWENIVFYRGSPVFGGPNAYHELGMHDRENELYQIGLELFPDDIDIISRQAICTLSKGDSINAMTYINKLIPLFKKDGDQEKDIAFHLAIIYESAKMFDMAEKEYLKALALNPGDSWITYSLIQMMIFNDIKTEKAYKMLQDMLNKYPDRIYFIGLKGIYSFKQGEIEEAYRLLKQHIEIYSFTALYVPIIREIEQAMDLKKWQ